VTCPLAVGGSATSAVERAPRRGVWITTGEVYEPTGGAKGRFVLRYAELTPESIGGGVRIIAEVLAESRTRP
jgi:DNA-binding transcriptional MocR family regulator